jgi:hypothetical protein
MEQAIVLASWALYRGLAAGLAGAGWVLSKAGAALRQAGQHLRERVARL